MENDYELIYLIRSNLSGQLAFQVLREKYQSLIYKYLYLFHLDDNLDFYLQEGFLCLWNCVKMFAEDYNKTFNRYFEMHLRWHFTDLLNEKNRLVLKEDSFFDDAFTQVDQRKRDIQTGQLTAEEAYLYDQYFVLHYKPKVIAASMGIGMRRMYYLLSTLRTKLMVLNQEYKPSPVKVRETMTVDPVISETENEEE